MWRDLIETLIEMFIVGALAVALIVFPFGIFIAIDVAVSRSACENVAEVSERRTEYRLWKGCFVHIRATDEMVPIGNWRVEDE